MRQLVLGVCAVLAAASAGAQIVREAGGAGAVGNGAPPAQALFAPYHLDYTDRLCGADYGNQEARCVDSGLMQRRASFAGRPIGIARDPSDGRVYVSTARINITPPVPAGLWAIETSGTVRALPMGASIAPYGITLWGGFLWWVDQQGNGLWRVEVPCLTSCTPQQMIAAGVLLNPQDVECRSGLGCLIADTSHHRIKLFDLNSQVSTVAGVGTTGFSGDGGPALAAQFSFPTGVTVTPAGVVLVADSNNNRVRRFTLGGVVSTIAGNGQGNSAKALPAPGQSPTTFPITNPAGIAVDPGNVAHVGSNFVGAIYSFPLSSEPVATVTMTATRTATAPPATPTVVATATQTATPTRTCPVGCVPDEG